MLPKPLQLEKKPKLVVFPIILVLRFKKGVRQTCARSESPGTCSFRIFSRQRNDALDSHCKGAANVSFDSRATWYPWLGLSKLLRELWFWSQVQFCLFSWPGAVKRDPGFGSCKRSPYPSRFKASTVVTCYMYAKRDLTRSRSSWITG